MVTLETLSKKGQNYIQDESYLNTKGNWGAQWKAIAIKIIDTLQEMKEDENMVFPAELYSSCIDSFDIYSEFWKSLVKFEKQHPERFE